MPNQVRSVQIARVGGKNLSIDTDPQQQMAASPQDVVVGRSSSPWAIYRMKHSILIFWVAVYGFVWLLRRPPPERRQPGRVCLDWSSSHCQRNLGKVSAPLGQLFLRLALSVFSCPLSASRRCIALPLRRRRRVVQSHALRTAPWHRSSSSGNAGLPREGRQSSMAWPKSHLS